ncbi:MFS transporter [Psychrobacillus sp. FSL W7-1457]|uniref:MFS transporter n=1 Tax=unclassified Psychrobacillus TaxID=2636677 RepID=UPI0030FC501B
MQKEYKAMEVNVLYFIVAIIILITFIVTTFLSLLVSKKWGRRHAMLTSFGVNACLLGIVAAILYEMDAKEFLKNTNSFNVMLLAVPVLSWINCFVIMQKSKTYTSNRMQ